MQTLCPVCDAPIPCDKGALDKAMSCPHCQVTFHAVAIPDEAQLRQRAERQVLLYHYLLPVVSVLTLFSCTAGAFWYSATINRAGNEQAAADDSNSGTPAPRIGTSGSQQPLTPPVAQQQPQDTTGAGAVAADSPGSTAPAGQPGSGSMGQVATTPVDPETTEEDPRVKVLPQKDPVSVPLSRNFASQAADSSAADATAAADQFVEFQGCSWLGIEGTSWLSLSESGTTSFQTDSGASVDLSAARLSDEFRVTGVVHSEAVLAAMGDESGVLTVIEREGAPAAYYRVHSDRITGICAFGRSRSLVTCALDGTLQVINLRNMTVAMTLQLPAPAWRLAISESERAIAVGCADRTIILASHNASDAAVVLRCGVPVDVLAVSSSEILAVGGGGTIEVYNALRSELLWKREHPETRVTAMFLSRTAHLLVVGTEDGSLLVYRVSDGDVLKSRTFDSAIREVRIAPHSNHVALMTQDAIDEGGTPVVFSPWDELAAAGGAM